MKVTLSSQAQRDLEDIGDYIARDNPQRAESFIAEIEAKCLDLADSPTAFPIVQRYRARGLRKRNHGRYLIFYEVGADELRIVRIMHGARDWTDLLDAR